MVFPEFNSEKVLGSPFTIGLAKITYCPFYLTKLL